MVSGMENAANGGTDKKPDLDNDGWLFCSF